MSGANGKTAATANGATPAAGGLDFDALALERKTVPVRKAGREWLLRWDVPAEVLVQRLLLREIAERTAAVQQEIEAAGMPVGEQVAALRERMVTEFDAYRADVLRICGDIFRHSCPEMSDEEIAEHFNTNEQRYIVDYFFTRLTPRSSPPHSDGNAAPVASTAADSTTPPNRASRRAATSKRKR